MHGSMIEFASPAGSTPGYLSGYLSLPDTGSGAGLVLIQEWWGLVDHIKELADRFASAGFVTLAPDLYHGVSARSPDQAQKMSMALDIGRAGQEIRSAAQHLLAMPQVTPNKVGVIGFCMGGQLALYAATEYPDVISACVDFYGLYPNVRIDAARLQVPVLAHFGRADPMVVRGDVDALLQKLSDAGKFVDSYYYDASHAFFNDDRPDAYNADAALLAWDRTLAFLRDSLR